MLVRAGSGVQAARGNRNGGCDGVQGVTDGLQSNPWLLWSSVAWESPAACSSWSAHGYQRAIIHTDIISKP